MYHPLVATSQESVQNTIQECANSSRRDILTSEKTPLNTKGSVSARQFEFFFSDCYTVEMRGHFVHKNKDSLVLVRLMQYTAVLGQNSILVNICDALRDLVPFVQFKKT